ncbi:wax ester/triacylglycerol synthase domain-containing protein [Streptomyces griseus]|uniref:wax ester/triacylglycerol synthase domain-containing protein n=1 Tax=Streptomyces griseus TaxID=1911 RepID=UPI00084066D6|nr:wax ester/triacylglycerol synthase domain-containing protein [Streptomyces griseus]
MPAPDQSARPTRLDLTARPDATVPAGRSAGHDRSAALPGHPTHSVDRAFLSLERRRPDVRWDAGGVAYLSGPPPALADLRMYVGFRLRGMPLLTSRIEGGRRPRWRPDPDFAVDRHVHEVVADGPAAWDSALDTALNAPFAPGAYWGLWLVHGHAPDAYAVCYRFHHACQDGSAAAMTFRAVLGDGEPSARPVPGRGGRAGALHRAFAAAGLTTRCVAATFPVRGLRSEAAFTPSGERRLWRGRVPAATLRRIGGTRGGSGHDAHLAALAGALSVWSARAGVALPRVTAVLPVDARRPDEDQTWGNRCFALPLGLPVSTAAEHPDGSRDGDAPLRRLDAVTRTTRRLRGEAWRQAVQDMVRFMPARPTEWYMRRVLSPRVTDVMATSMPLAGKGSLGEAQVTGTALLPLLLPGHLFGVGLSFFGEWAEVAFLADRALPLGGLLPELWEQAVAELEESATAV